MDDKRDYVRFHFHSNCEIRNTHDRDVDQRNNKNKMYRLYMSINLLPTEIMRLARVWTSIVYRCTKPENKQYKNYGGRGITLCKEWEDFNNFCRDVGLRPDETYHLDRIDNDKGYYKENCRWTSPKINHRNKRNNHYYETHIGKMCQSELIEKIGFTKRQFQRAIEKFGEKEFLKMYQENRLPNKRIKPNLLDLIGMKFDTFTILELDEDKSTGIRYFCVCDCGRENRISRFNLMNKTSFHCKSCSRRGVNNPKSKLRKEGLIHSPLPEISIKS